MGKVAFPSSRSRPAWNEYKVADRCDAQCPTSEDADYDGFFLERMFFKLWKNAETVPNVRIWSAGFFSMNS